MQKNKKYLVIMIWISVISFIAASMVGWGDYTFSTANKVASVGRINITADDLNNEYSVLYDEYDKDYRKATGKPLDKEQAALFKLEEQAMNRLINKALMRNFALDYGLDVSDEEVATYIQDISSFQENGLYSNTLYKDILKKNRIRPSEYEKRVKEALLLDKIIAVFNAKPTPIEKILFSIPEILKDNIEIKVVNISNIGNNIKNEELIDYYKNNKDKYIEYSFNVEEIVVNVDDVKASKSDVMQYYEDNKSNYVKNGVLEKFDDIQNVVENDYKKREANKKAFKFMNDFKGGVKKVIYSDQTSSDIIIDTLKTTKVGSITSPIFMDDKFFVLKLLDNNKNIKPYSKVKDIVYRDYKPISDKNAMEKYAKTNLNLFRGINVGYFRYNDSKRMQNLNDFEKRQLLVKIFASSKRNGYIVLSDKVVLYRILDQIIDKRLETNNDIIMNIKGGILDQTIIEFLKTKYKIVNNFNKGLA